MKLLLIAFAAMIFSARPAVADIAYGVDYFNPPWEMNLEFTNGGWAASGDGVLLTPNFINMSSYQGPAQSGSATVGNYGIAEGVEFQVHFWPISDYCSVSVMDNSGVERVLLYVENGFVYGMFEGTEFGPLTLFDTEVFRVILHTPASGESYNWSLTVTEEEFNQNIELSGNPRPTPAPFSGPVTLQLYADPEMEAHINYVRLIGDNITPDESLSWSTVKALYR